MKPGWEDMRCYALATDTRENFACSRRAVCAWEQANPTTLDGVLVWIDSLRELLGEPPTNMDPWLENDFRF